MSINHISSQLTETKTKTCPLFLVCRNEFRLTSVSPLVSHDDTFYLGECLSFRQPDPTFNNNSASGKLLSFGRSFQFCVFDIMEDDEHRRPLKGIFQGSIPFQCFYTLH